MKILSRFLVMFLSVTCLAQLPTIDVAKSKDQTSGSSVIVSGLTTSQPDLLIALISTDGPGGTGFSVTGVTTTGLTWKRAVQANGEQGTAEIWYAYSLNALSSASVTAKLPSSLSASMTVIAIANANQTTPIGAVSSKSQITGAPTATINTMGSNSLVFAVGNDWDNAIGRTLPSNQSLLHQYLSPVGDTYWMQQVNGYVASPGAVTVYDTAPTGDRFNLAAVEVMSGSSAPMPTYSVTGSITPFSLGNGAAITLTQNGALISSVNADSNGNFSFSGLSNGSYTVTPSKNGVTFTPASQPVTINGANGSVSFTAAQNPPPPPPPPPPSGPIKLLQANDAGIDSSTVNQISVQFKNPTVAGSSFLVTGTCKLPAGQMAIRDSAGNNFELIAGPMSNPNQDMEGYMWRVRTSVGGSDTITLSATTGACEMETHISEWQGLDVTTLVDQFQYLEGDSGTTFSVGPVTPTLSGELVFGYGFPFGDATVGSGFTQLSEIDGDVTEYTLQSTAAPISATFNRDRSGTWFALVATFAASQ